MALLESGKLEYSTLYITQRLARSRRFYFLAQATEHIPNSLILRKCIGSVYQWLSYSTKTPSLCLLRDQYKPESQSVLTLVLTPQFSKHQLGIFLPLQRLQPIHHLHHQILPNSIHLFATQPNLLRHIPFHPTPSLLDHPQRPTHTLHPRTHHPLRRRTVPLERFDRDQVAHKFFLALAQSEVCEAVLVRDGLVRYSAQRQDERHDDAGTIFACSAVDKDGGWGVAGAAGEVAQDEGEGAVGFGTCEEDAGVDFDEALFFHD